MRDGHFIWKGSANIPDTNFKKIDGYIHTENKKQ